eukprot:g20324.t1
MPVIVSCVAGRPFAALSTTRVRKAFQIEVTFTRPPFPTPLGQLARNRVVGWTGAASPHLGRMASSCHDDGALLVRGSVDNGSLGRANVPEAPETMDLTWL